MSFRSNVAVAYELVQVETLVPDCPESLPLIDPEFDHTVVDFSEDAMLTVTQVDEAGRTHVLMLSASMVRQLMPSLIRWNALNN